MHDRFHSEATSERISDRKNQRLACSLQTAYDVVLRDATRREVGEKIRELRKSQNLTQKELGDLVGVGFAYLSKVENERLDFGDYPSEVLICKLARALDADEDELMLLAKKIPEHIRHRVLERPDAFRKFADLGDADIDRLLEEMEKRRREK
jgi:transcriptional regulator with XRE-family HTH domain